MILSEDEKELLKNKTNNKDNFLTTKGREELLIESNSDDNAEEFLNLNDSGNENAADHENNKFFAKNDSKEKNLILKNKLSQAVLPSNSKKNRMQKINSFLNNFKKISKQLTGKAFNIENNNINNNADDKKDLKNNFIAVENEEEEIDNDDLQINFDLFRFFSEQTKQIMKEGFENNFFDSKEKY